MKKAAKIMAFIIALVILSAMAVGCAKAPAGEAVTVTLKMVYGDGSEEDIRLTTECDTLGDAMLEAELIKADEYKTGLVTYINGVTADFSKDEAWWCFYNAKGEVSMVGIADMELEDGAVYKAVYTVGME